MSCKRVASALASPQRLDERQKARFPDRLWAALAGARSGYLPLDEEGEEPEHAEPDEGDEERERQLPSWKSASASASVSPDGEG